MTGDLLGSAVPCPGPIGTTLLALALLAFPRPAAPQDGTIEGLVAALHHGDESQRVHAASVLGGIHRPPAAVVDALARALKDPSAQVGSAAARSLAAIGPDAVTALPALLFAREEEDAERRATAAMALVHLDGEARRHTAALLEELARCARWGGDAPDPPLSDARPARPATIDLLVATLDYTAGRYRAAAALALGRLGGTNAAAVAALVRAVRGGEEPLARVAALALGDLGAAGAPAVSALAEALAGYDPGLRILAAHALGGIGPAAASVAQALGTVGPAAVPALADLIEIVRDRRNDALVRAQAARALGRIAPQDLHALAALLECLMGFTEPAVLRAVVASLGDFGPRARQALPYLNALASQFPDFAADAEEAISRISRR